jgi:hypothetical protein
LQVLEELKMSRFRSSRLSLAVATVGIVGLLTALHADTPPKNEPKSPAAHAGDKAPEAKPASIKPKPLSDVIKKGLEYLVKQQHENGGWGQGGGWRTNLDQKAGGARIEGAEVADPPDLGNTCVALLALIRAGNTPTDGPYAKNVARGLDFVMGKVEKSDKDSLYVTDVKGTQIQSKIGPYIDTFLAALVLAEVKGKMGDGKIEKRLIACTDKTIGKIQKNQKADGTFAGNDGWASVLSQGVGNKALNYAAQRGINVDGEALARVQKQVAGNFDAKNGAFRMAGDGGRGLAGGRAGAPATGFGGGGAAAGAPSDAGVPLYAQGQGFGNSGDIVNTRRIEAEKARAVLAKKDAPKEERDKAEKTLKDLRDAEKQLEEATKAVAAQLKQPDFIKGFGSNGGEEFLSFMNIGESLLVKGGKDFQEWDKAITENLNRVQDKDGSWSGHHCITGKTFCTATALLVLMTDRAPIPVCTAKEPPKPAPPAEAKPEK